MALQNIEVSPPPLKKTPQQSTPPKEKALALADSMSERGML